MSPQSKNKQSNSQQELIVAVMGATGTGKSTFINLASGTEFGVGDGLISCTSNVAYSEPFEVNGRTVRLIDTPGFDDTNKSDTDILKMIALNLSMTYEAGFKLSGIIYMHRISDFRVGGISRRNFNMFRKLCGDDSLENVVLVTNMWTLVEKARGDAREKELMEDERLFRPVLEKGARMVRHDNTRESAHRILRQIVRNTPSALQIQKELVEQGKDISQTAAAVELDRELAALAQKHMEELKEIKQEMEEALAARDEETREELEMFQAKLEGDMKKIQEDRDRLSSEYAAEKQRADEQIARMMKSLEDSEKFRAEGEKRLANLHEEHKKGLERSEAERRALMETIKTMNERREPGFFECLGNALGALFSFRF